MRDMIEGLLERERLDGGHAALMLQDCGWSDWVEDLLQRRFASPMAQGLLSVRIEPGLPVVRLDRMRMQVLLGNLLDNALRYNDAAKGAVQLRLQRVGPSADASSGLLLQVRDFGPGGARGCTAPAGTAVLPSRRGPHPSQRRRGPGAEPVFHDRPSPWRQPDAAQWTSGFGGDAALAFAVERGMTLAAS